MNFSNSTSNQNSNLENIKKELTQLINLHNIDLSLQKITQTPINSTNVKYVNEASNISKIISDFEKNKLSSQEFREIIQNSLNNPNNQFERIQTENQSQNSQRSFKEAFEGGNKIPSKFPKSHNTDHNQNEKQFDNFEVHLPNENDENAKLKSKIENYKNQIASLENEKEELKKITLVEQAELANLESEFTRVNSALRDLENKKGVKAKSRIFNGAGSNSRGHSSSRRIDSSLGESRMRGNSMDLRGSSFHSGFGNDHGGSFKGGNNRIFDSPGFGNNKNLHGGRGFNKGL